MYVVVPLGGLGSRFKDEGYTVPKPLVKAAGEKILNRVVRQLAITEGDTLLIGYSAELAPYQFETVFRKDNPGVGNVKFVKLEHATRGAAETLLVILNSFELDPTKPVLSVDCDTVFNDDVVSAFRATAGNAIFCFDDEGDRPIYSYIKTNSSGDVTMIKEKAKISTMACTGAYGFASVASCRAHIDRAIACNKMSKGEYYISCVYEVILAAGERVRAVRAPSRACLGTPAELKENVALGRLAHVPKRYCFDLDGTLVTHPLVRGDYSTVQPIKGTARLVRDLYAAGNHIIIYTARGMRTFGGDVNAVTNAHRTAIEASLRDLRIPYHELVLGKPYADFYVDDLAVNAFADLEKETGHYVDRIQARSFNSIEYRDDTVVKITANEGEVFWYLNAPSRIKHYLPDASLTMPNKICMERIRGVSASMLYVNNSLTCAQLELVFEALDAFHGCAHSQPPVDTSQLYVAKLRERHDMMEGAFKDESLVSKLTAHLKTYCNTLGPAVVMHGDPVFSNVMFDRQGCIKLMDMRGKVGRDQTILGDAMYDWAKVHQSLTGYDHVMMDKVCDVAALKRGPCYTAFVDAVVKRFGRQGMADMELLTSAFYYTLIPLHDTRQQLFLRMSQNALQAYEKCSCVVPTREVAGDNKLIKAIRSKKSENGVRVREDEGGAGE